MKRRTFLLAPVLLPMVAHAQGAAPLNPQDRADIARIEANLNAIHTLHSRFLQVAPNGATSEGQAWLERPGRMRFQYEPPAPFLLVAGHGLLVFYDSQLKQTSNIPLGQHAARLAAAGQSAPLRRYHGVRASPACPARSRSRSTGPARRRTARSR